MKFDLRALRVSLVPWIQLSLLHVAFLEVEPTAVYGIALVEEVLLVFSHCLFAAFQLVLLFLLALDMKALEHLVLQWTIRLLDLPPLYFR